MCTQLCCAGAQAAARVTFAHGVTGCGLSLAAGVVILADLLQARPSAPNPNVGCAILYRADIAMRLFLTALGSCSRRMPSLSNPWGGAVWTPWGSGCTAAFDYGRVLHMRLVRFVAACTVHAHEDSYSYVVPFLLAVLQMALRARQADCGACDRGLWCLRDMSMLLEGESDSARVARPRAVVNASDLSFRGIRGHYLDYKKRCSRVTQGADDRRRVAGTVAIGWPQPYRVNASLAPRPPAESVACRDAAHPPIPQAGFKFFRASTIDGFVSCLRADSGKQQQQQQQSR
jgi:hypothetical protein